MSAFASFFFCVTNLVRDDVTRLNMNLRFRFQTQKQAQKKDVENVVMLCNIYSYNSEKIEFPIQASREFCVVLKSFDTSSYFCDFMNK